MLLRCCSRLLRRFPREACVAGPGEGMNKIYIARSKTYSIPPDYSGVPILEPSKLKFIDKAPNLAQPKKEPKNLADIRGPTSDPSASVFRDGDYGIVALGGGYLHWGHFEMMRLTINRFMDPKTMFARWRINAPYKPVTRKGLGQRMGGGKGSIDHYVTPVKYGQIVVEIGGHCEFVEVERILKKIAKKLPFKAQAVSRKTLEEMHQEEERMEKENQNPWTFERIVKANMLGSRKVLSPYDLKLKGKFWGKFRLPDRV
ncbi:large ribosomal subunit protein uL16m [Microcaecilia unicolor]|uniref:Large ribosomal subunit protein uL16m n=1 Tax=Microcaecilia unicolor TaxID=1415580 RepID=A0A6P7ZF86_9AMPH|nr:39S ribosomal protein L16, mitochondrial [Microcaecilia unicolor]XP_030078004.1 39S ribosomal protein L16, mitochondrial [Microcaecilia unicolor]